MHEVDIDDVFNGLSVIFQVSFSSKLSEEELSESHIHILRTTYSTYIPCQLEYSRTTVTEVTALTGRLDNFIFKSQRHLICNLERADIRCASSNIKQDECLSCLVTCC